MQEFFNGRMILHKDYFENVNEIKNAYHFAKDVLDYFCKKIQFFGFRLKNLAISQTFSVAITKKAVQDNS